jgi:hypothetical protein
VLFQGGCGHAACLIQRLAGVLDELIDGRRRVDLQDLDDLRLIDLYSL